MNKNNYTLEFLIIYKVIYMYSLDLPGGRVVKNLPMQETQVMQGRSLGWEDPLEEEMARTPVFLPGKSHRQRRLMGCNPWGRKVGHDWAAEHTTLMLLFSAVLLVAITETWICHVSMISNPFQALPTYQIYLI